MYITQKEYPKLWKQVGEELSITERAKGFEVDENAYLRFRYEADETMGNLQPSLCDLITGNEIRYATNSEIELSRKVDGGPILADGHKCIIREIDKELWAIWSAHTHPGFSKDTQVPEIAEKNTAPHTTAGLPKILDAAQHLITSIEKATGSVSKAIASDKKHDVDLKLSVSDSVKLDHSHKFVAKIEVEHKIPALDALIELLKPRASNYKKAFLVVLWAIFIALVLLISGIKLHAQQPASNIYTIKFTDSIGTPIVTFAAPFTIQCLSNLTCTRSGSTITIQSSGGGVGGCTPPGTTNNLLYDTGTGCGDLGALGTTTTLLHGNAAGLPTFGAVVSADLNITGTTCTNQLIRVLSSAAAGTCATVTSSFVDSSIGLTGNPLSQFASTTSSQLAGVISDETGTAGALVFSISPALTGSPTVPTQATSDNSTKMASTAYVTTAVANAISGVNPAVAVQAATTASGDTSGLTYNNGASGIGAFFTGSVNTAIVIDGYTFNALGQRLLVKNDTQSPSGAFNGIYYVTQVQTAILAPILTRALDYNQPSDINNTGAIPVVNGTVNANTSWLLTSTVTAVGTDPLTYVQFSIAPSTIVTSTAALTSNSIVLGAGGQGAKTVAAIVTDGTSKITLGTDNSVLGSMQMANSAANAHTTWAAGATTTNTIAGFATVPTNGHLVTCTVASTTCTLTDGGAVPTGTVTSIATTSPITGGPIIATGTLSCATCVTSAASLTSKGVMIGGGGQASSTIDFPDVKVIPAANCNNTTAGAGLSIPASNAPTVVCGAAITTAYTNNLGGFLGWANNNTTTNAQFNFELPVDWDTATQPYIAIYYGAGENTSGTVKWTFSSACSKQDGSVTDDAAFVAESASAGKTMAAKNREWAESVQFAGITSGNNCIGGSSVVIKVTSGNGTATGVVNVSKLVVTVPRLLTVQAN